MGGWWGEAFSRQAFQACVCVCLLTLASNHPSKAHTSHRSTEWIAKWWCYWNSWIMQIYNNLSIGTILCLVSSCLAEDRNTLYSLFSFCNPSLVFSCCWRTKYACVHPPPPSPSPSSSLFVLACHAWWKPEGDFFFPLLKTTGTRPLSHSKLLLHCDVHQSAGHSPSPYTVASVQKLPSLLPDWGPIRLHKGCPFSSSLAQTHTTH